MQLISETKISGPAQNVSGTSDNIGLFYYGWPAYSMIRPGWTCVETGAVVVAVGDGTTDRTITTSGTPFASGGEYRFTGPTGLQLSGGMTLKASKPSLIIATNDGGGLVGWNPTSLAIAYSPTVISAYPVGSTITWQDGSTATIVGWDDYGPLYIDLFWDTPKTGILFPITLTN